MAALLTIWCPRHITSLASCPHGPIWDFAYHQNDVMELARVNDPDRQSALNADSYRLFVTDLVYALHRGEPVEIDMSGFTQDFPALNTAANPESKITFGEETDQSNDELSME